MSEYDYRDHVEMTLYENEDEFVLELIRPYCEKIVERHLPKIIIKRALLTYQREHEEEWNYLLERSNNETI